MCPGNFESVIVVQRVMHHASCGMVNTGKLPGQFGRLRPAQDFAERKQERAVVLALFGDKDTA